MRRRAASSPLPQALGGLPPAEPLAPLLAEIRACRRCAQRFPHVPHPVVRATDSIKIRVIGQAPGIRVHESGIPWNDPSGQRLRAWMGLSLAQFYDPRFLGVTAMGFCFPGYDAAGGDLPPPALCARLWQHRLTAALPSVRLTLLVGALAQRFHLGAAAPVSMTETVRAWRSFGPAMMPLPHPSWRNAAWLKRNSWFETDLLPELRRRVAALLPAPAGGQASASEMGIEHPA